MEKIKYPRFFRDGSTWKLTPIEIQEMKRLYYEGEKVKDLAKRFNITEPAVNYQLKDSYKKRQAEKNKEYKLNIPKEVINKRALILKRRKLKEQSEEYRKFLQQFKKYLPKIFKCPNCGYQDVRNIFA